MTNLTFTPSPGSLTMSLDSESDVVGALSVLEVTITPVNDIPQGGKIYMKIPKWNPEYSQPKSMFHFTSSTGGPVTCINQGGLSPDPSLECMFSKATSIDTLELSKGFKNATPGGSEIKFKVQDFKNPPSTKQLSNFSIYTTDSSGNKIDEGLNGSLQVTIPAKLKVEDMSIEPSVLNINEKTSYEFSLRIGNPMGQTSFVLIQFPEAYQLYSESGSKLIQQVIGIGSINSSPSITYDDSVIPNQIKISNIVPPDDNYLEQGSWIQLVLSDIINPGFVDQFSFKVATYQDSIHIIEEITSGLFLDSDLIPGNIFGASVSAQDKTINTETRYEIRFNTKNAIPVDGIIVITFPVKVTSHSKTTCDGVITGLSPSSKCEVYDNKHLEITFPFDDPLEGGSQIGLYVNGVTNPKSEQPSPSFSIYTYNTDKKLIDKITEGVQVIAQADGAQLTVIGSTYETYVVNDIIFTMQLEQGIMVDSVLRLEVPNQVEIVQEDFGCSERSGFTTGIQCTHTNNVIMITNGYDYIDPSMEDSQLTIQFEISGLRNPYSTKPTDTFRLAVLDSNSFAQYGSSNIAKLTMSRSTEFSNVSITPLSKTNGAITTYTFSITVATLIKSNDYIQIVPPEDEIEFVNPTCSGRECFMRDEMLFVKVIQRMEFGNKIDIEVQGVRNPISLGQSSSFAVYAVTSDTQFKINQKTTNLRITNTQKALITEAWAQPDSNELGAITNYQISYIPVNKMPSGSTITITVPSQISVTTLSCESIYILSPSLQCSFNPSSRDIQITSGFPSPMTSIQKISVKLSGLRNPSTAIETDSFKIESKTRFGDPIDYIENGISFRRECDPQCKTCMGEIDHCMSCHFGDPLFGELLHQNTCVQQCPPGWYEASDKTCMPCQGDCDECVGGPKVCTKCRQDGERGFILRDQNACYDTCPEGTWANKATHACEKCQEPCGTCESRTKCKTCADAEFFYWDSFCYETCPETTVQVGNQCVGCASPCLTCNETPDQCLTCIFSPKTHYLHKSQCLDVCPQFYEVGPDLDCVYQGEQLVPFPFFVVAIVCIIMILIQKIYKKKRVDLISLLISLFSTLLPFLMIILCVLLFKDSHYQSFGIVLVAFTINLILNTIWYRKHVLVFREDQDYQYWHMSMPCLSKFMQVVSLLVTFQLQRVLTARLFKCFEAVTFTKPHQQLLKNLGVWQIALCLCPLIFANVYNMFYTNAVRQIFYSNLESLCIAIALLVLLIVKYCKRIKDKDYSHMRQTSTNNKTDQTMIREEIGDVDSDRTNPTSALQKTIKKQSKLHHLVEKFFHQHPGDFYQLKGAIECNMRMPNDRYSPQQSPTYKSMDGEILQGIIREYESAQPTPLKGDDLITGAKSRIRDDDTQPDQAYIDIHTGRSTYYDAYSNMPPTRTASETRNRNSVLPPINPSSRGTQYGAFSPSYRMPTSSIPKGANLDLPPKTSYGSRMSNMMMTPNSGRPMIMPFQQSSASRRHVNDTERMLRTFQKSRGQKKLQKLNRSTLRKSRQSPGEEFESPESQRHTQQEYIESLQKKVEEYETMKEQWARDSRAIEVKTRTNQEQSAKKFNDELQERLVQEIHKIVQDPDKLAQYQKGATQPEGDKGSTQKLSFRDTEDNEARLDQKKPDPIKLDEDMNDSDFKPVPINHFFEVPKQQDGIRNITQRIDQSRSPTKSPSKSPTKSPQPTIRNRDLPLLNRSTSRSPVKHNTLANGIRHSPSKLNKSPLLDSEEKDNLRMSNLFKKGMPGYLQSQQQRLPSPTSPVKKDSKANSPAKRGGNQPMQKYNSNGRPEDSVSFSYNKDKMMKANTLYNEKDKLESSIIGTSHFPNQDDDSQDYGFKILNPRKADQTERSGPNFYINDEPSAINNSHNITPTSETADLTIISKLPVSAQKNPTDLTHKKNQNSPAPLDAEFEHIMTLKSMSRPQSKYTRAAQQMGKQTYRGPSADANDPETRYVLRSAMVKAGRDITTGAQPSLCNSSRQSDFNTEKHQELDLPKIANWHK